MDCVAPYISPPIESGKRIFTIHKSAMIQLNNDSLPFIADRLHPPHTGFPFTSTQEKVPLQVLIFGGHYKIFRRNKISKLSTGEWMLETHRLVTFSKQPERRHGVSGWCSA